MPPPELPMTLLGSIESFTGYQVTLVSMEPCRVNVDFELGGRSYRFEFDPDIAWFIKFHQHKTRDAGTYGILSSEVPEVGLTYAGTVEQAVNCVMRICDDVMLCLHAIDGHYYNGSHAYALWYQLSAAKDDESYAVFVTLITCKSILQTWYRKAKPNHTVIEFREEVEDGPQ